MSGMAAPDHMTAAHGGVADGITWAVCPAPMWGALNGYVQIPEGHPWHGLGYDEIHEAHPGLRVHGGLTFARDGWVGFDALHAGDMWPEQPHEHRLGRPCDCLMWTPALVVGEAVRLAVQVAVVGEGGSL